MKCLNCGRETEELLCTECRTEEILSALFDLLIYFMPEACENPYINAYVATIPEGTAPREMIPQLLALFPNEVAEYYACLYARAICDPQFETKALTYLGAHDPGERNSRRIMQKLLDFYLRDDFIKPRKWCDLVREQGIAGAELITIVIQNYSMTGEYDLAEQMIKSAQDICRKGETQFLYGLKDQARMDRHMERLDKLMANNERYRTGKPYWPSTEERRRAIAILYDEKGIQYPRIENRPQKVAESDFKTLHEYSGSGLTSYCTFWCSAGFSIVAAKCIYQIAAVRVEKEEIVDQFQSYVRPWDSASVRKAAARDAKVAVEVLESAEDVDLVMKKFFEFVDDAVLVSTDALGEQANLISRAARYTGMTEIKNCFLDLLDLAEDILPDLDFAKNFRKYLLEYFNIPEGKDALTKAMANQKLYQKLKVMG